MKKSGFVKLLLGVFLFSFCLTGTMTGNPQSVVSRSKAQDKKREQILLKKAEMKLQQESLQIERRNKIRNLQMDDHLLDRKRPLEPDAEMKEKGPKTADAGSQDRTIVTSATVYLTVDAAPVSGDINPANDPDYYQFTVTTAGYYAIETWLGTLPDSYMYLYGPDNPATLIEEDDDGGTGLASKIWRYLSAGTYYVTITAFSSMETGTYTISVVTSPPREPFRAGSPTLQRLAYRTFTLRSTIWIIMILGMDILMPTAIIRFRACLPVILRFTSTTAA